ncbi:MAG: bifunctional oligoribonuclease/PAP phosphatase NrnA [Bacteroidales bacterium]
MDKKRINKLASFLADKAQSIGIIVHASPDGDAIGSSLGLYAYLRNLGFSSVYVIAPDPYASFLHWMPGNDQVIIAEKQMQYVTGIIADADLLFCLDFNGFSRTNNLEKALTDSPAKKIMIDHHPQPENGFDICFSDTSPSSTAEMVYEVITAMGDEEAITLEMAQCLYTGIVTDTGSFSYGCNNPRTYEITARLIEKGVDGAYLHRLIYSTYSVERMRLLGYCLSSKLFVLEQYHTAYISLTQDDLKRFNHQEGDTEGIVNYALSIEGMKLAALFTEKDDHVKVSFRSAGEVDVNLLARNHFNGGGHKNAAGGKYFSGLADTLAYFETLVKKEMD